MKVSALGHIEVSGKVAEYNDLKQTLEFGFVTDQTCLAALIADFNTLLT